MGRQRVRTRRYFPEQLETIKSKDVRLERVLEGRLGLSLEEHLEKSRIRGYSYECKVRTTE